MGRKYTVTLDGYDPHNLQAESASKARYASFRSYWEAYGSQPYARTKREAWLWFSRRATTYAMGEVRP